VLGRQITHVSILSYSLSPISHPQTHITMIRGVKPVLRLPQTASRGLNRPAAPSASFSTRISPASSTSASASASSKRPSAALAAYTSRVAVISARASYSKSPYDKIDVKAEKKLAKQKLEARPEEVSTESTTRQFVEKTPAPPGKEEDVQDGLAHDLVGSYILQGWLMPIRPLVSVLT
jgi:hypothetical protein